MNARLAAGLATILLLLCFALSAGVLVLNYRPDIVGLAAQQDLDATSQAIRQTEEALNATASALMSTAEYNAARSFANESTLAALENRQIQVEQRATQAALDIEATLTGIAFSNAQQATRAVLDFQGTQTAFDRMATQVELEYQGTRAAINREATAAALGFATRAPAGQDVLQQTPPPTITQIPLFTDRFDSGISGVTWNFQSVEDWTLDPQGVLTAQRTGAWLLTQDASLRDYGLEVVLNPLVGAGRAADYYVLLNIPTNTTSGDGLAVRLSFDGSRLAAAGLYHVSRSQVLAVVDLLTGQLEAIQTVQLNLPPEETLRVRVDVRGAHVVVVANDALVVDVTLETAPPAGAVGVQIPIGAQIRAVSLLP